MGPLTRLAALLLAPLLAAAPLTAQVRGLPVVNTGVPIGLGLAADVGFANVPAGKGTSIGGSAALGLGLLGLTAGVSRTEPDVGEVGWSQGAAASLNVVGGPLVPIRVTLMGGAGRWKENDLTVTRYPLSLGLSATIPIPALAIKPWLAPRYERLAVEGAGHDDRWAIAGGIDLAMLNGFSLRAAYDHTFVLGKKPGILSFGVGFAP